jgi:hypothetical protein
MRISTFKNKIKTTWNIVKSETGRKTDLEEIPTISYNGIRIDDQRTMSSNFNDYFSSRAEKIMCTNITDRITHLDKGDKITNVPQISSLAYPRIKYKNISTQEVGKIIKSLKTKNSYSYDELSVRVLKRSSFVVSPLTHICNKCLEMGIFPSRLKFSTVKPIY